MSRTILICDDDRVMRNAYTDALGRIDDVKVISIEHPDRVLDVLKANSETAVLLMDLEFPTTPGAETKAVLGHHYLPAIRRDFAHIKVVVVTRLGPSVYEVVLECNRRQLADDWIDVGKGFKPEELQARVEALVYPLGRISRKGLWLLQISDLHFGNSAKFAYWGLAEDGALMDAIRRDFKKSVSSDIGQPFTGVDLLLVNGDVSDKGRDHEFAKGSVFLTQLVEECLNEHAGNDVVERRQRLVVVPGNHDVNWDLSRARSLGWDSVSKTWTYRKQESETDVADELRYIRKYIWAPFDQFIHQLQLPRPTFDTLWDLEHSFAGGAWWFPALGLTVYGVNTSATGVSHLTDEPNVQPAVVQQLEHFASRHAAVKQPAPSVIMSHHSLGSLHSGAARVNDKDIGRLREAFADRLDARIFLTGHVHKQICELISVEHASILFIGAGTGGVVDAAGADTELLHYNLINIRAEDPTLQNSATVAVYPRLVMDGVFAKHPRTPKLLYEWDRTSGWVLREG